MNSSKKSVMLIEDNDYDVKRVVRGFAKLGDDRSVIRARDGVEALSILRGEAALNPPEQPFVIMLDLNMPRMDGIGFLDEIRADKALSKTPVYVVTTSDYHSDIRKAYDRCVCGYFVKPGTSDEMVKILEILARYWDACEISD